MIVVYTLAAVGAVTVAFTTLLFLGRKPVATLRGQYLERWGNKP